MRQVDMVRLDLSTGKAEKTKDCVAEEFSPANSAKKVISSTNELVV